MSLTYKGIRSGHAALARVHNYTLGADIFMYIPLLSNVDFATAIAKICSGDLEEVVADFVSINISDDQYNFIEDSPSFDGDNACFHQSIKGDLTLVNTDITSSDWNCVFSHADRYGNRYIYPEGHTSFTALETWERVTTGTTSSHSHASGALFSINAETNVSYRGRPWYDVTGITTYFGGKLSELVHNEGNSGRDKTYITTLKPSMFVQIYINKKGIDERYLRKQYSTMVNYFFRGLEQCQSPGNLEFLASQEAALSYQAYDFNLIEAAFDLKGGLDALLPTRTADDILKLLDKSRFATLPSKLVDLAVTASNAYLYSKYAVAPTVSDLSSLEMVDVDPETVNSSLQTLAEQLVYKGSKVVSRYGHASARVISPRIGQVDIMTNARIRAYPRYLKDMSDAAIIIDNIGLSLSAERLTEAIPYEFVAEWFLPIEESVRSIEYNDSRLNSMWEIKGLCLSTRKTASLGSLRANFGFSDFSGDLVFTHYGRHTEVRFPSTRLPSIGPADINPSRLLQGSALIITHG